MMRLGGLRVVFSDALPWEEKEIGHHIYWAHPIVQWLSRWLPIKPYVSAPLIRRWRDAFRMGDTLVIPPEMKMHIDRLEEVA